MGRDDIDLGRVAAALGGAQRTGNGFDVRCPCHDDRSASLSISIGDEGQLLWHCHAGCEWDKVRDELRRRGFLEGAERKRRLAGSPPRGRIVATYDYLDEAGELVFQVCRLDPKDFRQRRRARAGDDPAKVRDGWTWSVKGLRAVPFRMPELLEAIAGEWPVFVVEGEKDADSLARLGITATCNAGGAGKWRREHAAALSGADVIILPDNDDAGREHGEAVAKSVAGVARRVRVVDLPGLPPKGDVSDWLGAGHGPDELWRLVDAAPDWQASGASAAGGVELEDFWAYLPEGRFIYRPTGALWPASGVDGAIKRDRRALKASVWLARNQAVHQMTWAPGEVEIIEGRHLVEGGWVSKAGARTYNAYRPPRPIEGGDPAQAGPWLDHLRFCFPSDTEHLLDWLASRVQAPAVKINHALVIGGAQGLGKDTILAPIRVAVGEWNFAEIGPTAVMGRFTGFVRATILRINEGHDTGDVNRYQFYERTKTFIAAPPEALACELKGANPISVPNVVGVIITTNHKTNGIFLPPDDRRHYVAWSDATKEDFAPDYFRGLWSWYRAGGDGHVAAFLRARDLTAFDPKAPPPQTDAWWEIANAGIAPERHDLGDVIQSLGEPAALIVADLIGEANRENPGLATWLKDRATRRLIPIRLEEAGYIAARNPQDRQRGRWLVGQRLTTVYARKSLSTAERIEAAQAYAAQRRGYVATLA